MLPSIWHLLLGLLVAFTFCHYSQANDASAARRPGRDQSHPQVLISTMRQFLLSDRSPELPEIESMFQMTPMQYKGLVPASGFHPVSSTLPELRSALIKSQVENDLPGRYSARLIVSAPFSTCVSNHDFFVAFPGQSLFDDRRLPFAVFSSNEALTRLNGASELQIQLFFTNHCLSRLLLQSYFGPERGPGSPGDLGDSEVVQSPPTNRGFVK